LISYPCRTSFPFPFYLPTSFPVTRKYFLIPGFLMLSPSQAASGVPI
jgi:hypothetical protein